MPITRSSRVLYSGCCLWYFALWFWSCWSGVGLSVMCPVCRMLQHPANRTHNPQLHTRPATWKPQHEISILQTRHITLSYTPDQLLENHSTKCHRQQPLYNTLELLTMGIVVPETCWASNKICNKKPLLHLAGILFPHTIFPLFLIWLIPTVHFAHLSTPPRNVINQVTRTQTLYYPNITYNNLRTQQGVPLKVN